MSWLYRLFKRNNEETFVRASVPIVPDDVAAATASAVAYPVNPTVFRIVIPNTAGNYDFTMPFKVKVIDAWLVCTGVAPASGDLIRLLNGTDAITDDKAMGTTALATLRFTTYTTYQDIAAAGTLRVTATKNTNCACNVYVMVLPIA